MTAVVARLLWLHDCCGGPFVVSVPTGCLQRVTDYSVLMAVPWCTNLLWSHDCCGYSHHKLYLPHTLTELREEQLQLSVQTQHSTKAQDVWQIGDTQCSNMGHVQFHHCLYRSKI